MTNRNTLASLALGLLLTTLLGACASTPKPVFDYKQDYDFSQVKKIAFFIGSGEVTGSNPMQLSDFQKERIDDALARNLTGKGYQMVDDPDEADLLISWHLGVQDKTDVRTYETPSAGMSYGYYSGYNRYSMYNCWNCTNTEVRVINYTEGTFIIDMIDPQLRKSVWRSVTQSKLRGNQNDDPEAVNNAAALVLGEFPPQ